MIQKFFQSPMGIILIVILVLWISFKFQAFLQKIKGNVGNQKRRDCDFKAIQQLKKLGFTLLQQNPKLHSYLLVESLREEISITPDLIMEKDGLEWIIEVKSGDEENLRASNRRQLLEYKTHAPSMGVGFYFVDRQKWLPIEFPLLRKAPKSIQLHRNQFSWNTFLGGGLFTMTLILLLYTLY